MSENHDKFEALVNDLESNGQLPVSFEIESATLERDPNNPEQYFYIVVQEAFEMFLFGMEEKQAEVDALTSENDRLRGISPGFNGMTSERFGIRWNGPTEPLCVPMEDGYWTPWHLAQEKIESEKFRIAQLESLLSSYKDKYYDLKDGLKEEQCS